MLLQDGKVMPRELTEEEKEAAVDAKGGKGKPPAKDAKKGAVAEEPTPEEKERLEKEEAERKERERIQQEEWDALDEDTKHIRHSEDIFKEPCVKLQNLSVITDVEALEKELAEVPEDEENQPQREQIQAKIDAIVGESNVGTKKCPKFSYELVELEE